MWASNGTVDGTVQLTPPGIVVTPNPSHLMNVGPETAILVSDPERGRVLWRTDGTPVGTSPVRDDGGMLLDEVDPLGLVLDDRLVVTRLTSNGVSIALALGERPVSVLLEVSNELATVFGVASTGETGEPRLLVGRGFSTDDNALWAVDASGDAEALIPESGRYLVPRVLRDGVVARRRFIVESDEDEIDVWYTDGTPAGTQLVASGISSAGAAQFGDRLLVLARRTPSLIAIDGPSGRVETLIDNAHLFDIQRSRVIDGLAILNISSTGFEDNLWRTDGKREGTFPLTDFASDPRSVDLREMLPAGDDIFFPASRDDVGRELWAVPRRDLGMPSLALRADDRFTISVRWTKPDGESGYGVPSRLTSDTGYFYFFRESNVELMIKLLDGRSENGHFWVFYGALSNVAYEITVTDTVTGMVKTYQNPADRFASVGDTRAFRVPGRWSQLETGNSSLEAALDAIVPGGLAIESSFASQLAKSHGGCLTTSETLCLQQSRFRVQVE